MDFRFTDEQQLLQDMLTDFITDRYGFDARMAAMAEPDGFSRATWRALAELGILAVPFAETDGGLGGGGVESMIVAEALGKGLLLEPYLATAMLAGGILRHAGTAEQKAARIPAIVRGEHVMALAHHEPRGPRHSVSCAATRAQPLGRGWRLTGSKTAVIAGASADELVVSAAVADGVGLFLVDPASPLVSIRRRTGYDGIAIADIDFDAVTVSADALLGTPGAAGPVLERVFEEANAALCAEAVGIMADLLDTTVEYLKTRTQFGVAIGSCQALQHRAVDMLMELELGRSMAMLAALSLDREPGERALNIAAAKARVGRAGRFVGQAAVQLHGAIGLTEEYKVGHGFKRLTAIDALFGDSDHHLEVIADAGGLIPIV